MSNTISNKALKLKLNPNSSQYSRFLKFFGCERFVYNFYLNEKNQFYEKEIKPLGSSSTKSLKDTFKFENLTSLLFGIPTFINKSPLKVLSPKV